MGQLLNYIVLLYNWNGIIDVNLENVKVFVEEVGKIMVWEFVYNFLMDFCCLFKYGINFYDVFLGIFGRGGNLIFLYFLLGLKIVVDDELVVDFVVNIFKVCLDLLNKYFKEVIFFFIL